MKKEQATNQELYLAYKTIRNKIRRYYPEQIISKCISLLHKENNIKHLKQYPPWLLILILKWTIRDGEFLNPDRKKLSDADFNQIINLVHEYDGKLILPSNFKEFVFLLRILAYQQFLHQDQYLIPRFARQQLLFGALPDNHSLKQKFKEITQLSISDFLEISILLLAKFLTVGGVSLKIDFFRAVYNVYPEKLISNYLKIISKDIKSLNKILQKENKKNTDMRIEYYEHSSLLRYPFLKYNDHFYLYSLPILLYALQNFIYDLFREYNSNFFMNKFGNIFEKYINDLINYSGAKFYCEDELRKQLNTNNKIVDFCICENNSNILIDAKAVEFSIPGIINLNPVVITDRLKSSVIKGIKQGFETIAAGQKINNKVFRFEEKTNYLIIVTFKELLLGSGNHFYKYIAKDRLDKIRADYSSVNNFKFENMFFISIDDFELLINCVKKKSITFEKILKKAVQDDSSEETSKFLFNMHIKDNFGCNDLPDILIDEFDKLKNNVSTKLKGN